VHIKIKTVFGFCTLVFELDFSDASLNRRQSTKIKAQRSSLLFHRRRGSALEFPPNEFDQVVYCFRLSACRQSRHAVATLVNLLYEFRVVMTQRMALAQCRHLQFRSVLQLNRAAFAVLSMTFLAVLVIDLFYAGELDRASIAAWRYCCSGSYLQRVRRFIFARSHEKKTGSGNECDCVTHSHQSLHNGRDDSQNFRSIPRRSVTLRAFANRQRQQAE
jgi:hypothetical protein